MGIFLESENDPYDYLSHNVHFTTAEKWVSYISTPILTICGIYILIKQIRNRKEYW